nr:MFS transporter [Candidatus Njordarchaeum guaymaensis]
MKHNPIDKRSVYAAIVLLGVLSLFGDVIYEGARGLVPDYLNFLGVSALIVGIVGGLGEFLGYALRLFTGTAADATRAYWLFIFVGYGLIVSIPLLGVIATWEIAVILVLIERIGKAFRAPSRDTVLSIVSKDIGAGKAFGIHEFLDQIGALLGPLLVALIMLYTFNNYQLTFTLLALPFLMLLVALVYTYRKIGSRTIVKPKTTGEKGKGLGKPFYVYTFAVLLNTVGLIPVALILFKASAILQPEHQGWMVPLIYLLVQGVDAAIALAAGIAYDKFGIRVLALAFTLSLFPPLFAMFGTGLLTLVVASIFFGVVLGMQESIYRAAVSKLSPIYSRGTAYGIFNTAYGVGFLISGGIYGYFMDFGVPFCLTLLFVVSTQGAAIVALLGAHRASKTKIKRTS